MINIREEFKKAHPDIAEKLQSNEYSFLYENEHLGDNICLLGLGGSYSYGMNIEGSDIDIRGVATLRKEEILGTQNFEQFENAETDTVIYGIKKFFSLLSACNPNIVELVGLRGCDYIYISPIGQMILDNKDLFLSKRAAASFGGYANAQLKRIRMATMRDLLPNLEKQEYMMTSMENSIFNLMSKHDLFKYGEFNLKVDTATEDILVETNFKDLPVGQYIDMMNTLKTVKQDYDKYVGHRNQKATEKKLNKHQAHLIRLYNMGIEILEKSEVNTYREEDHQLLMDIRNGKFMNDDGLVSAEFYSIVDTLETKLNKLKETSKLSKNPDYKKIEELLISINNLSLLTSYGIGND